MLANRIPILINLVLIVLVAVLGAFVRASMSGDGCGQSWPLCQGRFVPQLNSEARTWIEFSHRFLSGVSLAYGIALTLYAKKRFEPASYYWLRLFLLFLFIECLIGAVLVRFQMVTTDTSRIRAIVLTGHFINTFLLVATASLALFDSARSSARHSIQRLKEYWVSLVFITLVGISGAIAALAGSLFPADSFDQALELDFASSSPLITRIRVLHPILATLFFFYLLRISIHISDRFDRIKLRLVLITQYICGALAVIVLAPIALQLTHLFLAYVLLITFLFTILKRDSR